MRKRSYWKAFALASTFFLAGPLLSFAQKAHWTYGGSEGPAEWGKLEPDYAACSVGKNQSPIDIKGAKPQDLPALQFNYSSAPLSIIDNGHTIQINYAPGNTLAVGNKTYTLKQFHFHHPSEEHVNGQGYDMVAHLVHADADGHLAVVAVLLEKGSSNALIDTLWKNLPSEKEKAVDVPGVTVNLKQLLPGARGYYTFAGSLTTPPCSEGVTWYVLKQPVSVSADQIAAFARIYPMNARPIQPTNERELRETKEK